MNMIPLLLFVQMLPTTLNERKIERGNIFDDIKLNKMSIKIWICCTIFPICHLLDLLPLDVNALHFVEYHIPVHGVWKKHISDV